MQLGNKANISLSDVSASYALYVLSLASWLFSAVLLTSNFSATGVGTLLKALSVASLAGCLLSELFFTETTPKTVLIAIGMSAIAGIAFIHGGTAIFALLMFVYCGRHYPFKKLGKIAFLVEIIAVVVVLLAFKFGLIEDTLAIEPTRVRSSLGFGWVTFLSHYYLNIVILFFYLRGKKAGISSILICAFLNFLIYRATVSRNSFLLVFVFLFLFVIIRYMSPRIYANRFT